MPGLIPYGFIMVFLLYSIGSSSNAGEERRFESCAAKKLISNDFVDKI